MVLFGKHVVSEVTLGVTVLDKDAAFAVFRFGASMDADAGATGDLADEWHQAFEFRRGCYNKRVGADRDDVILVLQSVAEK